VKRGKLSIAHAICEEAARTREWGFGTPQGGKGTGGKKQKVGQGDRQPENQEESLHSTVKGPKMEGPGYLMGPSREWLIKKDWRGQVRGGTMLGLRSE